MQRDISSFLEDLSQLMLQAWCDEMVVAPAKRLHNNSFKWPVEKGEVYSLRKITLAQGALEQQDICNLIYSAWQLECTHALLLLLQIVLLSHHTCGQPCSQVMLHYLPVIPCIIAGSPRTSVVS